MFLSFGSPRKYSSRHGEVGLKFENEIIYPLTFFKGCENSQTIKTAHGVKILAPMSAFCFLLLVVVCLVFWFESGEDAAPFTVAVFGLPLAGLGCGSCGSSSSLVVKARCPRC